MKRPPLTSDEDWADFHAGWRADMTTEFCAHSETQHDLNPRPVDPYDEDNYCCFCGNGRWKLHAPWCFWQDAVDEVPTTS